LVGGGGGGAGGGGGGVSYPLGLAVSATTMVLVGPLAHVTYE